MFNWLKRWFRPAAPPPIKKCPMMEPLNCGLCSLNYVCIDPRKDTTTATSIPRLSPSPDIIGRQAGQKRNRVHIYRQPFGYPIRACDWIAVDIENIEEQGRVQGPNGPADDLRVLASALDWREIYHNARICKHCRNLATGKRTSCGMNLHGRGKGVT